MTEQNYCGYCDNGRTLVESHPCKNCGRLRPADPPRYPELEKMRAVREKSMLLSEFVDWLEQNDMRICVRTKSNGVYASPYESVPMRYEELFAKFFDIDLKKVDQERELVLEELRLSNERGKKP